MTETKFKSLLVINPVRRDLCSQETTLKKAEFQIFMKNFPLPNQFQWLSHCSIFMIRFKERKKLLKHRNFYLKGKITLCRNSFKAKLETRLFGETPFNEFTDSLPCFCDSGAMQMYFKRRKAVYIPLGLLALVLKVSSSLKKRKVSELNFSKKDLKQKVLSEI